MEITQCLQIQEMGNGEVAVQGDLCWEDSELSRLKIFHPLCESYWSLQEAEKCAVHWFSLATECIRLDTFDG